MRIEQEYGTIETREGSVLRLDTRTLASKQVMRTFGDVVNGKMNLTMEGAGQRQQMTIPWDNNIRGPYAVEQSLSRAPMKPGETRDLRMYNGPGYIRAGIEDGYELLPQVASRLEIRRRELEDQIQNLEMKRQQASESRKQADEEAAITYVLERLEPAEVKRLLKRALHLLPEPIVRRNPTLSNPFIRVKVYELACGEP